MVDLEDHRSEQHDGRRAGVEDHDVASAAGDVHREDKLEKDEGERAQAVEPGNSGGLGRRDAHNSLVHLRSGENVVRVEDESGQHVHEGRVEDLELVVGLEGELRLVAQGHVLVAVGVGVVVGYVVVAEVGVGPQLGAAGAEAARECANNLVGSGVHCAGVAGLVHDHHCKQVVGENKSDRGKRDAGDVAVDADEVEGDDEDSLGQEEAGVLDALLVLAGCLSICERDIK